MRLLAELLRRARRMQLGKPWDLGLRPYHVIVIDPSAVIAADLSRVTMTRAKQETRVGCFNACWPEAVLQWCLQYLCACRRQLPQHV